MKDGTIGVLVVEDDDDFCFLIGDTLGREPDMRILGSTASGEEAVYLAQRLDPDIVLMDLNLLRGIGRHRSGAQNPPVYAREGDPCDCL